MYWSFLTIVLCTWNYYFFNPLNKFVSNIYFIASKAYQQLVIVCNIRIVKALVILILVDLFFLQPIIR